MKRFSIISTILVIFSLYSFAQKDVIISGGNAISATVCENSVLYVWGSNKIGTSLGILGTGSSADYISSPTEVSYFSYNDIYIKQVSCGNGMHFAALDCQGKVWCWGSNSLGQCGTGTIANSEGAVQATPVQVALGTSSLAGTEYDDGNGYLCNVDVVYAGNYNTFAILGEGQYKGCLVGWGGNSTGFDSQGYDYAYGQLGCGNVDNQPYPVFVQIPGGQLLQGVVQVCAGDNSAYALVDQDGDGIGTIYSWGYQKGNGSLGRSATGGVGSANWDGNDPYARPVKMGDGTNLDNIKMLACGDMVGFGLDVDGYIWAWGNGAWNNATGVLDANYSWYSGGDSYATPLRVRKGLTTGASNDGTYLLAKSVAGGQGFGMAITADNKPVAWGGGGCEDGGGGATGSKIGQSSSNVGAEYIVFGSGTIHDDVISIDRGDTWGFYRRSSGDMYAWGCNNYGQLGVGSTSSYTRATKINPPTSCNYRNPKPFAHITPSEVTACAASAFEGVTLDCGFEISSSDLLDSYTITWYKDGVQVLTGNATKNTYATPAGENGIGTYRVVVSYVGSNGGCSSYDDAEDEMTISALQQPFSIPSLTYCSDVATVNVTTSNNTAEYTWYANQLATTVLGKSTGEEEITIDLSGVSGSQNEKTIYVQETSIGSGVFLPESDNRWKNGSGDILQSGNISSSSAYSTGFFVNEPITLTSMSCYVNAYLYTSGSESATITFSIYGATTNNGGYVPNTSDDPYGTFSGTVDVTSTNTQDSQKILLTGSVSLPAGHYFIVPTKLELSTTSVQFKLKQGQTSATSTDVDNLTGTIMQFQSIARGSNPNSTGSGYVFDITFSVGQKYCGIVPVTLTHACPITYTAPDATLCKGGNMKYTVSADAIIPSTLTLVVGLESFTGSLKNGRYYEFDLSGISTAGGALTAELKADGETVATSTITIKTPPDLVILSDESTYHTGAEYTFSASATAESYAWSMGTYPDGGTYEFVNGYSSQSTTIKFNTAGQYELWCAVTDANGCSSNNFTYVTVEEGSSTPVTVTNGGSVTFVPGSSATLVGCVGEYPYVSFEGENLNLAQPQSGSGSGQANFSEGSYNSFTFEFVSAGTYYFNIYPVGQENDIMVLNLQINEKPDVPTITSSDDTFLAGQTYTFTANTSSQDVTYEWTLSGLPYDGASIDGSNTEKTVSVVFNSALQPGQGTFTLYCEVTSNGCSAIGQKNIEMSSGTTQQDITYTATPQTFCYGDEAEFVVKASQEVEEDYYIMVLLSNSSFYGSHRSDAIDGDEIYFRLNDLPAAEYEVMIYSSDSLNLLVESATMTVGSPIRPTISYDEGEFNVGETVSFFNENYVAEDVSYTWSVDNRDHTFVGATNGETTSIQFLGAENYTVKCQAMDDNGCTSYDTYSLEVENPNPTAVCSINGTTYNSLKTALQAVQSGDEITILDNIYESANYVEKNRTFTINTNGKTVNFGVIIAMANVTITGGGVVTTTLDNSNTNGSDVLTVDGATLNLDGSQWMAKNVAVVHGGNLTLMNDIFLGGGDEDGFNLTIDDTSSFNINGKHISAYNNERVAAQIRPYLPSGYTVDDNLNFSPDANVTLQMPTITYTAEAQLFCEEWSGAVYEYVVTASQSLPQKDYILVAGGKSFHSTPVEDTIKFQLQYLGEADTYDVTLLNADSTTVLAESTVTIYAADVQEPTNVEIVHEEEYNYEKYELNVPYTYTVTNPIEGYEYSWEITYYGGDNNFAADPEDYVMETNSDNTIMTVTFLHSGDYRVEFWDRTCNSGSEMSVYIPAVYTAEPKTFYDSDSTFTYSVAVSEKVWDEDEEFILVVGDKSFHTFGVYGDFSLDFTLSGLVAGTYDNVTMYDTDSANVLAGPTTIEVVPVVCNNTNLTYTYNEDSKNYTSVRESVIPYAAAGDEFVVAWTGTADFTGQLGFALIDRSEEANWWRIVSDWESVPVERGTEFTISKTFTIADSVTSAPNIAFFSTIDIVAGNPTICESELSFTKLCKNLTLEGSNSVALAYLDETVAASDIFHYHIKGTSGFSGEALLSFADVSEAAGYWDALSESKTISVVENEEFDVEGYFIADKAPSSSTPVVAFTVGRAGASSGETSTICVLESEISNYGADFECDGQKIALESDYGKLLMDISDEVAVDDKYYCHVEGVADFSGNVFIAMVDRSEEAQWWFTLTNVITFSVTEGEPFEFNHVFQAVDQTPSTNPIFSIMIGHAGSTEGEVSQICITDSEIEKLLACSSDATQVEFEYYEESENYTYLLDGVATNAVAGDVYTIVWSGTPDFSGQLGFALVDRSEAANWWKEVAEWESIQIEKGVPFTINKTFTLTDSVSAASEIAFFATIDDKVGYGSSICQTEFSFTQQCHNAALVGSLSVPLAYVDGSVAKNDIYNYNVKGHSDFAGEVMLSLVDQSEEAGWWDMLTDGQVVTVEKDEDFEFSGYFIADKATSSTTPDVRFVINRTVDATVTDTTNLCISESTFSQYGADFACDGEKLIFNGTNGKAVASLSEVAVGDVYECNIEGTADFTGEMYIALVDHSAEADWWFELAQSSVIQVVEGESFEFNGTFTVANQTASTTPEFALMIGHGDAETGSISQVCVTNASIRKPTVYTVSDITLCEYQTIASVTVTAEPAAIFEVVSETGDVIQSFSGETSYANFNISDLTVGAYKYYIKENGAAKDSFNITLYANPTVTITTSSESICVGDEVSFIANATGNDLTYQWENSSLEIADATSETAKWQSTVAGQYPISCTVTGEGGCTASTELVFLVNPVPVVSIEGNTEVIAGDEITYTAETSDDVVSYNWFGAVQETQQTLTTTFSSEGNQILYCEVTTNEGCKNTDTLNVAVSPAMVCEEPNKTIDFSYNADSENYTYTFESVTTNAVAGDVYTIVWSGTPDFSGQLGFALVDRSEGANWWRIVSDWTSTTVERGVPFSVSATLIIADSVSSLSEIAFFSTIEGKEGQPVVCETNFSFTQQCHNVALVGSSSATLAYVEGSVAKSDVYHYVVKGHSDFSGEVMLSLVDQSEEAGWWDMLTDGQIATVYEGTDFEFEGYFNADKAVSSSNPDVRFTINRTVDGTVTDTTNLCVTESSFSQYGADFACTVEKLVLKGDTGGSLATLDELMVGDKYDYQIEGTADFTGEVYIALVDHSEEAGWWLEMAQPATIEVVAGEAFNYEGTFTIEGITKSRTPDFRLMIGHGGAETGSISQVCITNASIRKPTVYTVSDITLCETQTIASVSITADPAAIFDVVSETGDVIQSFSGETSEANFNIFDLTVGAYKYYIKENGAAKDSFNITVYPNPSIDFTFSPESICVGDTVTFEPNAIDGNYYSYQWDGSDGYIYQTIGNFYMQWIPKLAGQYSIPCTVTSDDGCTTTVEHTVMVNPVPSVTIEGLNEVAAGEVVTYTAAVTYEGESTFVYEWSGAAQGSEQTLTTTFTDEGTSALYCEVMTREGCKSADTLDFIVYDYECDGTRLMFGSAESLNSLQKSIADEITEETTFNLSWTGTPNFTGVVQAVVIDASEEFSGMVLSQPIVEIEVEANKAFTVNQDVVVSASKSSKPNYVIEIFVPYQTEGFEATAPTVDICETAFSFVKVEQQPLSVSFSQDAYEMTAGGSATLCLVADGFDLSEATITYNVSKYLSAIDKQEGCVVVTDEKGIASTQQIEAEVLYKGTAYYATADIQIIEEQPACEGTFVTFTEFEESYNGTTYYFYETSHDVEISDASEDDTFEFEWSFTPNFSVNSVSVALVDLSNNNSSSATTYFTEGSNRTQTFNFSLPEGNNEKSTYAIKTTIQSNEIIENATLCESYFSFKKVEKSPYVKVFATEYNQWGSSTDGDDISDGWQAGFDEFPTAVYNATGNTEWNPAIGDVFSLSMQGVANFTGTVNFFMVDQSMEANFWGIASEHVPGFYVAEGEPFNITDYFAVTSIGNDDVTYAPNFVVLCQPNVTSTSDDFSEFVTYKLSLTNYGLSFYPSTATGTCDGNLITTLNAGLIDVSHYVDNAIVEGDKVTVNWSATPDFTGDLSVALVDGRNTAEDAWLFMTDPITFEVTKDVAFEVSMPFDVTDTHVNPFYQMYIAVNDREGSADVYNICSSEISVTIEKAGLPNYVKVFNLTYDEWGADVDDDEIADNWRTTTIAYESLGVDTYAPGFGDQVEYRFKGVADFTGKISLGLIDNREAACFYAEFSDYNDYYVTEGEEFVIEGSLAVSRIEGSCDESAVELINPLLNISCFPDVTSTNADFTTYKMYSLSLTDYSLVYEQKQASDCMLEITMENSDSKALAHVYEEVSVGDEYYAHVTGVADFTGEVFFAFIDNSEEANWWYMLDNETKGLSVVEGDTLNFEGYFTVSNPVLTSKPDIAFMVGLVDSEGLGKVANICVSSVEFVKQENTFTCEGDKLILNGAEGGALATFDEVSLGDVYTCHVEGVADFSDEVYIALVDHSKDAGWWFEMAEPLAFDVVAGEPFVYEGTFIVTEQTKSTAPEYVIYIGHSKAENGPISRFCITKSQIEKRDVVFTLSETEVSMIVGDKKQMTVVVSESDYPFEVTWNSTNPDVVSVEDGLVSALAEGTAEVQVLVNNKVVASASVIVNCEDYWVRFDKRNYEITEGESISACLSFGECFNQVDPQFEFNQNLISLAEPEDKESTCGIITGLTAGQTTVVVSAYANGVRYADTTFVIVNQKPALDYTLAFEKRTYEMYEGETVEACMIMGNAFEHDFHPEMVYDETVIAVNEPTEQQSDNCGSITGLKAGNSVLIIYTEIDEERYGDTVFVVVTKKDIQVPQMEVPVVTTNEIKLCYSKTQQDTIMLDAFVQVTSDDARLKWYDAAGNALISAPLIDPKTVGKRIYYVSQIASGYNESEKVALSVNIVYVAAPELNIYEQKVCDNTETKAFVAKSQNNEIYWYQGEGNPIAQNTNTFMPTEAGTYLVRAIDVANGCVSDFATVNYAVGHTVRPQIEVEKTEYALDEEIVLAVQSVDEEQYGVVWTIEGEVVQGTTATVVFAEEGNYKIPCTIVEKESGCFASDTVEISVKNTNIPVTAITVDPSAIELYEGEQSYLALSFTPAFATDRNYNIEIADTSIADVVGLTVFGLKEGETTATISSTSNSSATASITITVKKFVAAREISLPTVITMAPEETKTISAAVLPTNASYNEVFFTEKEDNVIRLSANGELTALAEGTSIITAYTKGGLKASSVVVVTASVAAITDIQVPERIEMKVGDSVSVSYKVVPATSLISQLNWSIGDEEMISFANGVVKAEKAGSTTLTVSFASIEKTIAIVVNESDAPVVITTPNVSATQGDDVKVDLTDVISDDNTAVEDLTVTTTSDKFNVAVENGVLTVTPKDDSFVGVDTVLVVVTDENNLSVELSVVVEITEIQNQAPEILMDTIMIKYNACNYIQLSELVSDDFTPYNKMKYSFTSNVKASVMLRKQLRLFTDNPDLESDILTMTATDAEGLSTTKDILLLLTALPNKAPKIAEIPTQNENDESKFGTIDLAQYVKDDYTSSSAIAWSAADAENLAVTISDGKATVKVLNEFWNGAAAVTFYAKDEEGLTDSTVVYYVRNVTIKKEEPSQEPTSEVVATWEGAPSFDFMTMKTIGVPGAQFILMASCSGYECTWSWDIPGAKGVDPTSLMQMITFDEPGTYDVTFTVQSPDGNFEKSITKENFLTVVGISERTPAICKGEAVVLTATEGLDSYYWSTGDVKNTTSDRPEETALYQVTMKKGMFTLIDTVTVKVSVPVALMEDSVMCKGTTFDLEAEGEFVSYTWNTGESTKAIALPDVVASYSVMAVDDMQCVSVDTFNLTTVNELPVIDLGPDQTPCDGTTVTLDAGTGFDYLWKNGSTEQTISLTAGTDSVWARIIDNNLCVNYDTVVVAFTYPYPEQIGVATFSETTDHIILAWEKTAGVNTVKYRIERETNVTDNWEKVGDDVMFAEAGLVVDEDVNYKQRAYKYRLVTTDGCGNEAVSEVHRSMISTTTRNDDGTKTLQWCAYEPMANVTQYLVLRGYDATAMDTVDQVPASNLYEIWNETDSKFVNDKDIKYRVVFRLKSEVNENAVNTLEGQPVEGYYTKAESGPFSLALSNIAELETVGVDDVPFADVIVYPTTFSSYINVAIAATVETNFKVEILNANGQLMARTQTGDVNKTVLQIPTDSFKQGVYTVKIFDGQQTKTIKVVK